MAPTMEMVREAATRPVAPKEVTRARDDVRALAHRVGVEAVARALGVLAVLDQ